MNTTEQKELHTLRHSIGIDDAGNGLEYRNHYCIGKECEDFAILVGLCEKGLMVNLGPQTMFGGMHVFQVTEAGKQFVRERKPPEKRLTRSQKRYRKFLSGGAAIGMKFGEWLKTDYAKGF